MNRALTAGEGTCFPPAGCPSCEWLSCMGSEATTAKAEQLAEMEKQFQELSISYHRCVAAEHSDEEAGLARRLNALLDDIGLLRKEMGE